MNRRAFLTLLALPFVAPFGRLAERLRLKFRKPTWTVTMEVESREPLILTVTWPGGQIERLAYPLKGRRYLTIPMYCPRPPEVKLAMQSASGFKLYGCQMDFIAPVRTGALSPGRTDSAAV